MTQPCSARKVAGTACSSSDSASVRTAAVSACQGFLVAGPDGEVQAGAEQVPFAAGDPVGQVAGVVGGGLGVRVVQPAPGVVAAPGRFQPGALGAQPSGGHRRRDRLDVQADVEPAGVGGERLEPAGPDLGRVAGDRQGRRVPVPGADVPGADPDAAGSHGRRQAVTSGGIRGGSLALPPGHRVLPPGSGGAACDDLAGQGGAGPGRRPGRVAAPGEHRRRLGAVQRSDGDPGGGQRPRRGGDRGGGRPGGWLADGDQDLPGEQVPAGRQLGEEAGVVQRGGFQRRVRQSRARCSRTRAAMADRSTRCARMRIWAGERSEFSHRPNAAVRACCSAGVRSAKFTVDAAATAT